MIHLHIYEYTSDVFHVSPKYLFNWSNTLNTTFSGYLLVECLIIIDLNFENNYYFIKLFLPILLS